MKRPPKPIHDAPTPAEPCFAYAMRSLIEPQPAQSSLIEQLHALKFGQF